MPYHSHFTLPAADQHDVDVAWFEKQKQRSVEKNDPRLRNWLNEEVDALKAYHDGHEDADRTAATMTRSISSSPVVDLDNYSNDILALDSLWAVLIRALVEIALARRLWKVQYIILALEKSIDDGDTQIATNDAAAYEQVKLDFHIPAISFLFMYNAREIYERVVHGELKDLTPAQLLPGVATQFENGLQRWSFWTRRFEELAQGGEGDEVAVAANSALRSMISCAYA
ncbi:hypothetical protein KCU91_g3186, partial [Aureobasidium melanogenum]